MWRNAIDGIIDRLMYRCELQPELDETYVLFCKSIFEELDHSIGFKYVNKRNRKRMKSRKPYWNDELHSLWKRMIKSENAFGRYLGNNRNIKQELYTQHKNTQKEFDKALISASRIYNKQKITEIETLCVDDPREFWYKLKDLGPRKQNDI